MIVSECRGYFLLFCVFVSALIDRPDLHLASTVIAIAATTAAVQWMNILKGNRVIFNIKKYLYLKVFLRKAAAVPPSQS